MRDLGWPLILFLNGSIVCILILFGYKSNPINNLDIKEIEKIVYVMEGNGELPENPIVVKNDFLIELKNIIKKSTPASNYAYSFLGYIQIYVKNQTPIQISITNSESQNIIIVNDIPLTIQIKTFELLDKMGVRLQQKLNNE